MNFGYLWGSGYSRTYNDFFYLRKEHFCPDCHTKLEKVAVSKLVNSESPEAKDFDFRMGKRYMRGDVLFTWDELECPACKKHLTVDEMKTLEGISPSKRAKDNALKKLLRYIIMLLIWIAVVLAIKHFQ